MKNNIFAIVSLFVCVLLVGLVTNNTYDQADQYVYGNVCKHVVKAQVAQKAFNAMIEDAHDTIKKDTLLLDRANKSIDSMMLLLEDKNEFRVFEAICINKITGGDYSMRNFR